jgi:hypothetical protein
MTTMRRTTITVTWDDTDGPNGDDAEEWAYTLRMGGIDVDSVTIQPDETPMERLGRESVEAHQRQMAGGGDDHAEG